MGEVSPFRKTSCIVSVVFLSSQFSSFCNILNATMQMGIEKEERFGSGGHAVAVCSAVAVPS